jgi:hypothetical protein
LTTGAERLISVLAGRRSPSHCKFCGRAIEWATKLSTERRDGSHNKASNVPLNPNALVLRYDRNEAGLKFEVLSANALHFTTCTKKPARQARPRMFGGRVSEQSMLFDPPAPPDPMPKNIGPASVFPGVLLYRGECMEVMDAMPANSVDACVTDRSLRPRLHGQIEWDTFKPGEHPQAAAERYEAARSNPEDNRKPSERLRPSSVRRRSRSSQNRVRPLGRSGQIAFQRVHGTSGHDRCTAS